MSFNIDFSDQAKSDIDALKKSGNEAVLKKIYVLLEELTEHSFEGTGKPELLKYNFADSWSRRINQEHRLVYEFTKDIVFNLSAKGHFN